MALAARAIGSLPAYVTDYFVPGLVTACFVALLTMIAGDQIALLPPRPPTPRETAAAAPTARAEWARVYPQLLSRLPPEQSRPPELGAVWATRSDQICGLVEIVGTGVPYMEPFYTVDGRPHFKSEDPWAYVNNWLGCAFDEWVPLQFGTYESGFCATRAGRGSRLGAIKCQGPRP